MVPVRPDEEDTGSCSNRQILESKFFDCTFPSFAVYSDDVFGISRHPLPHTRRVFQHVPDVEIRPLLKLRTEITST